jgi:hypothetical protein
VEFYLHSLYVFIAVVLKHTTRKITWKLRGINEFMSGYKPRSNYVKVNIYLHADSDNILNKWKNYFSQILNVRRASDIRQMTESLVREPSPLDAEISIVKLKNYNSPGNDQISAEFIQTGGEILHCEIH